MVFKDLECCSIELADLLNSSKQLKISTKVFQTQVVVKPPSYATCLAVHENECAIVRKSNLTDRSPQYVGSDWATTCVMLILETDEHVCCLHHDSPDETAVRMQQARYYLGQYCDLALQAVKVYAVGGYFDGDSNSKQSKMSKETIEEALKVLKSSDIHFELKLLCCYKANTGTNGRPIHMGVAFSISEGRVFPACLEDFFGPDSCVRAAFQGYNTEGYKRDLTLIFEPEREELRIKPFEVVMNKPYFKNLLRLDDYNLLQRSSTSPEVEPANFASNQRKKYAFFLENYPFMKNLFNGGRSVRVHKLTKENGVYVWKLTLVDVKV